MPTSFFGKEIYKNHDMAVEDSKVWLAAVDVGDPLIVDVLAQIATGQYPTPAKNIDGFIKVLEGSKHTVDETVLKHFCLDLQKIVLENVTFKSHSKNIRDFLMNNPRWEN